MSVTVLVEKSNGQYCASLVGSPALQAVRPSREEAIRALQAELTVRTAAGELVNLELAPLGVSGLAGIFRDDPELLGNLRGHLSRARRATASMIAFDADVLSDILRGDAALASRAALVPTAEQAVPIVVVEEILRGRLNSIRQAEGGKGKLTIEQAYQLFEATLAAFRQVNLLPYSASAETLFQQWRGAKVRLGTHDLRIAAICVVHSVKLVSRNRRDFDQVPGLDVEYWT